jgi:hypothetical protein
MGIISYDTAISATPPHLTKTDTAGEVLQVLVRCLGIVVISHRASSEVFQASPDAKRTPSL